MKKAKPSVEVPKVLLLFIKLIALVSPKLLVKFLAKLFSTPAKHKLPKRELGMDRDSIQKLVTIPSINREVMVYEYGKSSRKVLLVHGWSGRGTQLFKFADALVKNGYSTVSFDAPAHGRSAGKSTLMPEFVDTIHELDLQYGPFEAAIGHSLGGMSLLNAIKSGLILDALVIIGSGDIVDDIISDFIAKLNLKQKYVAKLRSHFENNSNSSMDDYSAYHAAAKTLIPTLVIHDEDDIEVPVKSGRHIHRHLKNGELMITKGLGHRKILGDENVIATTIQFIKNKQNEKLTHSARSMHHNIL